jgi:hypothetical protein
MVKSTFVSLLTFESKAVFFKRTAQKKNMIVDHVQKWGT